MNERPAPAEADARRWACAALGVAEDASPDAVRAAFLKQVGEADFYPSQESVVAWQWLAGATAADPRAERIVGQHTSEGLRAAVEQFAERFFAIDVNERVRQWFELNARCQSSAALLARLEGLSAGLHIDRVAVLANAPAPDGSADDSAPSERTLAEKTLELFVLRPVDRAERQQQLLQAWQIDQRANRREWQAAARRFKQQLPKIAELDREFVDTILDKPRPARRAAPQSPATNQKAAATTKKGSGWAGSIGAFIVLACISAVSRCARDESRIGNFKHPAQRQADEQLRKLRETPLPVLPPFEPIRPIIPLDSPTPQRFEQQPNPQDGFNDAIERLRKSVSPPLGPRPPTGGDRSFPQRQPIPAESPDQNPSAPTNDADERPPPDE